MLMVIITITGDFQAMSVTTNGVRPSAKPKPWQMGKLTLACSALGACFLGFWTGTLLVGQCRLRLDIGALQTIAMVALVFGWQSQTVRDSRPPMSGSVGRASDNPSWAVCKISRTTVTRYTAR